MRRNTFKVDNLTIFQVFGKTICLKCRSCYYYFHYYFYYCYQYHYYHYYYYYFYYYYCCSFIFITVTYRSILAKALTQDCRKLWLVENICKIVKKVVIYRKKKWQDSKKKSQNCRKKLQDYRKKFQFLEKSFGF